MTRALSRTHSANTANSSSTKFAHSSRLIRTLIELSVSDVEPSQADLAEKLGQLFDFSDALALSAAHEQGAKVALQFQTGAVTDTAASGRAHDVSLQQDVLQAVETEVLQVRSQLVNGIARSCARSEEHTSELQSRENLVCRLLL